MKKIQRRLLATAAVSMLFGALTLTGCSSKTEPSANSNAGSTAAASVQPVELHMKWWGSQSRHDLTLKAIKMFEEKYPNIKVVPEYSDFTAYWDKLAVQVGGGSAPDVMQMSTAYINDYVNRQSLLPLDNAGVQLGGIDNGSLSTGKIGGKLYGIPAGIGALGYVVDQSMLDKAGIKLPEHMTWDELANISKQTKEKLGSSVFGVPNDMAMIEMLNMYARQKGATVYKDDGTLGVTADLVTEYFNFWEKLRKDNITSNAEQTAAFFNKDLQFYPIVKSGTPFALLNSPQLGGIQALVKNPLEITFVPKMAGGKDADYVSPSMYWSVFAKSKHPKEAAMLLDFLTNDVEAGKLLGANRGIPAVGKIRDAIKPMLGDADKKQLEYVEKVSKIAQPINIIEPKGAGEVRQLLLNITQEIQFDKKTAQQGAAEFVEKAAGILKKAQ